MNPPGKTIFERLLGQEPIPYTDPAYTLIGEACRQAKRLTVALNQADSDADIRRLFGELTGKELDASTTVFTPFHTNYGRNISLGKGVFINHNCSFLDLGGITIEDNVMLSSYVTVSSETHPVEVNRRQTLLTAPVTIKRNAWIGANATILPGVTIGENSVVAAGAVVTNDVPDNTVVGGVPAKIIKSIT